MAMNNTERIAKGLRLLSEGLFDPVDEVMTKVFRSNEWNDAWSLSDAQKYGSSPRPMEKGDVQVQLRAITEYGREFNDILSRAQQSYASELREVRNTWAHDTQHNWDSEETLRALSTIELLLNAVSAPDSAADARELREQLQRSMYEGQARQKNRRKAISIDPTKGMKPWREVITPHEDVANGSFTTAEFAADLYQVAIAKTVCEDGDPYGDPIEFFNRTYLTEGLRDLLARAIRRLVGDGSGSPVVNLQTNFGGGKTHSMLALYHLFGDKTVTELSRDIQDLVSSLNVEPWRANSVKRVAIDGTKLNVATGTEKYDGTQVHTIWGEIAWQLGGREAFDMVAENDSLGKPPADILDRLLRRYGPCLILIDEWVAYARQLFNRDDLPAGTFDDQFTFAQTLTEVVSAVPGCMLVVSIPASDDSGEGNDIEVGGTNGQQALKRLQNVVGRKADQWRPSTRDESFEIVRKRLFEEPDAEAQQEIAVTAKRFVDMYRHDSKSYPAYASAPGNEYENRIRASYPLHPELLDRLYEDWSSLDNFQRTRGVLTLVSTIIHELWISDDSSPLVLPGNVPIDYESVNSRFTQYLRDSWKPVIDSDVSGSTSTAAKIDNDRSVLGTRHLTQRISRTVFLGSAPRFNMPNKGISAQTVWLGTAAPGDVQGNFGTALSMLEQRSTYFFSENGQYWYSLQPSISKTAREYAEQLRDDPESGFNEIVRRLASEAGVSKRGKFRRVCVAPSDNASIPDIDEATLVIMHPRWSVSSGEGSNSPTIQWVHNAIDHRASTQRVNRNMLIFLAPDANYIEQVQGTVRSYLGWKRVSDAEDSLNLTHQQSMQARMMMNKFDTQINKSIRDAYNWSLYPSQIDAKYDYKIEQNKVPDSGGDSMAQRVGAKLSQTDQLIDKFAYTSIGFEVLSHIRSAFVDGMLDVRTIWGYITRFPYMPRLVDREVFDQSVEGAVNNMGMTGEDRFALASSYDSDTQTFKNLIIPGVTDNSHDVLHVTDSTLIVDWDVAMKAHAAQQRQQLQLLQEEQRLEELGRHTSHLEEAGAGFKPGMSRFAPVDAFGGSGEHSDVNGAEAASSDSESGKLAASSKKHYWASIELDPDSTGSSLAHINEKILDQLRLDGVSNISVTLEIDATSSEPHGFSENAQSIINENAESLDLKDSGFEEI